MQGVAKLFQGVHGNKFVLSRRLSQLAGRHGVDGGTEAPQSAALFEPPLLLLPVGGPGQQDPLAQAKFEDGRVPALVDEGSHLEAGKSGLRIVGLKFLLQKVLEVVGVDRLARVGRPLYLGLVVLGHQGLDKLHPIFCRRLATLQGLRQLGLDKADVPFGQVGLGALLQKVPVDVVAGHHAGPKISAGHHGVPVAVHRGHVARQLHKFFYGLLPVTRLLRLAGVHKQPVGDVLHRQQESGAAAVVPAPGLVILGVVHEVDPRSQHPHRLEGLGSGDGRKTGRLFFSGQPLGQFGLFHQHLEFFQLLPQLGQRQCHPRFF